MSFDQIVLAILAKSFITNLPKSDISNLNVIEVEYDPTALH